MSSQLTPYIVNVNGGHGETIAFSRGNISNKSRAQPITTSHDRLNRDNVIQLKSLIVRVELVWQFVGESQSVGESVGELVGEFVGWSIGELVRVWRDFRPGLTTRASGRTVDVGGAVVVSGGSAPLWPLMCGMVHLDTD